MSDAMTEPEGSGLDPQDADRELADRVLSKLRSFVETLDDRERAMLACLLAPGIALAYEIDEDVTGFSADGPANGASPSSIPQAPNWLPSRLPEYLAESLRARRWRIIADG